ncbi:cytochrome c oxidase [Striga asiatica]|uniref:Cytochrome c oxidase n=1 Tax=Striga asiatica TaxID=4170 RepID=A0A5A7QHM2_STRAF|nr:cytochrome c oxidase [Striga asiatica]
MHTSGWHSSPTSASPPKRHHFVLLPFVLLLFELQKRPHVALHERLYVQRKRGVVQVGLLDPPVSERRGALEGGQVDYCGENDGEKMNLTEKEEKSLAALFAEISLSDGEWPTFDTVSGRR